MIFRFSAKKKRDQATMESEGNGNVGIKRSLSCSEEEDGFLGFDTGKRGLIS